MQCVCVLWYRHNEGLIFMEKVSYPTRKRKNVYNHDLVMKWNTINMLPLHPYSCHYYFKLFPHSSRGTDEIDSSTYVHQMMWQTSINWYKGFSKITNHCLSANSFGLQNLARSVSQCNLTTDIFPTTVTRLFAKHQILQNILCHSKSSSKKLL